MNEGVVDLAQQGVENTRPCSVRRKEKMENGCALLYHSRHDVGKSRDATKHLLRAEHTLNNGKRVEGGIIDADRSKMVAALPCKPRRAELGGGS
jgi:hypothetical protein